MSTKTCTTPERTGEEEEGREGENSEAGYLQAKIVKYCKINYSFQFNKATVKRLIDYFFNLTIQ